jgi:hypothetical protein
LRNCPAVPGRNARSLCATEADALLSHAGGLCRQHIQDPRSIRRGFCFRVLKGTVAEPCSPSPWGEATVQAAGKGARARVSLKIRKDSQAVRRPETLDPRGFSQDSQISQQVVFA